MKKQSPFFRNLLLCAALAVQGIAWLPRAGAQSVNEGWRFCKSEQTDVNRLTDREDWQTVSLPHTWNAFDGQDGGKGYHDAPLYYRGTGWYVKDLFFDKKSRQKQVYVRFGAANYAAEVFLNGQSVGTHFGGYTAFACDLTPFIRHGQTNRLAVRVSNARTLPVPPLHADFTFFGGLPREVALYEENKVHITPADSARAACM